MTKRKQYRLVPELVPIDLWQRSAYRMLGNRAVWKKKIRSDALANADNSCEICGSDDGVLVCHDKWKYDDKKAIATVVRFEIHCRGCDSVTHFGRLFKAGVDMMPILVHLGHVNGCNAKEVIAILRGATELWEKRSKKKWKVAVAPALLKRYPELEGLSKFKPAPIDS